MNNPTDEQKEKLWALCQLFITEHQISCAETIYQTDRVIENSYVLIEEICNIVGYDEREDDE